MKWLSSISSCTLAVTALLLTVAGCDSVGVTDVDDGLVHPTVSVHYVNVGLDAAKFAGNQAIVDVDLSVTSSSGFDYSPEPIQVNDATDDAANFELSLPPDSAFTFSARLTRDGELVAEGRVIQLITQEADDVSIPVVVADGDPFFAVFPSDIEIGVFEGTMELEMRLYGNRSGLRGLAVVMSQSGGNAADVSFVNNESFCRDGLDETPCALIDAEGDQASLAWHFGPEGAPLDLGATIEVPVDEAADFCLDIAEGDSKVVDGNGQIRIIGGSGACVHVIP